MDVLVSETTRRSMKANRSQDTKPEIMLRKKLWHCGIRYRKNFKQLPGTPDIVITKYRVAIFVDGDFWHAHGHEKNPGEQIKKNSSYWQKKIRAQHRAG